MTETVFSVGITLVDVYLNWLNWFHFIILKGRLLVILIDYLIFLSSFLDVTRIPMFLSLHSELLDFCGYRLLSFEVWSRI